MLVIGEILLVYEHSDCAFISFSFQCQIVSVDVSFCLSEYVSSAVEGPRFHAFFGVQAKEGRPFQLHGCAAQRTNAARFLVLFLVVFFKKDFSKFPDIFSHLVSEPKSQFRNSKKIGGALHKTRASPRTQSIRTSLGENAPQFSTNMHETS